MKHRGRGGVSVHTLTHPISIQREYQSQKETSPTPERHKSFHRAITATFPSHWLPRLLLPDEDSEGLDQHSPTLFMTMYMIELPVPRLGDKRVPRERRESQDHF